MKRTGCNDDLACLKNSLSCFNYVPPSWRITRSTGQFRRSGKLNVSVYRTK